MKKCPYCGKEYPDDLERCLVDNELLLGDGTTAHSPVPPLPESAPAEPPQFAKLSERQMRIIEVVLVCLIAFGASILTSTYYYFDGNYGGSGSSTFAWTVQTLHEVSVLGLLWYVLTRRQKTFADLGLIWRLGDVPLSIGLIMASSLVYYAVYEAIFLAGLTSLSHQATYARVGSMLFGGGIPLIAILFQIINPFFEELVVRAYFMTEIKSLTSSTSKAILASTLLQTSYHFYQGGPAAFSNAAVFLTFSIFYAKTKRITPLILAHLYSDVGATLWYYIFKHYITV